MAYLLGVVGLVLAVAARGRRAHQLLGRARRGRRPRRARRPRAARHALVRRPRDRGAPARLPPRGRAPVGPLRAPPRRARHAPHGARHAGPRRAEARPDRRDEPRSPSSTTARARSSRAGRSPRPSSSRVVARFGEVVIREPDVTRVESIPDLAPDRRRSRGRHDRSCSRPTRTRRHPDPLRGDRRPRPPRGAPRPPLGRARGAARARAPRRRDARRPRRPRPPRDRLLPQEEPRADRGHASRPRTTTRSPAPSGGRAPSITVIPPDVGEPEARRLDALRKLRDAFVDTPRVAPRATTCPPTAARAQGVRGRRAAGASTTTPSSSRRRSRARTPALRVPGRLQAMLRGQARKVQRGSDARSRRAGRGDARGRSCKATERLAPRRRRRRARPRPARHARRLASSSPTSPTTWRWAPRRCSAEPTASAARRAWTRAATVLAGRASARCMHLGGLGRDLGEIVEADLSRVDRARGRRRSRPRRDRRARPGGAPARAGSVVRRPGRLGRARGRRVGRRPRDAGRGRRRGRRRRAGVQHGGAGARAARAGSRRASSARSSRRCGDATERRRDEGSSRTRRRSTPRRCARRPGASRASAPGATRGRTRAPPRASTPRRWRARSSRGTPADAVEPGTRALDAIDEAKRDGAARAVARALRADRPNGDTDEAGKKLARGAPEARARGEVGRGEARGAPQEGRRAQGRRALRGGRRGAEDGRARARARPRRGKDQQALPEPALDALEERRAGGPRRRELAQARRRRPRARAAARRAAPARDGEGGARQRGQDDRTRRGRGPRSRRTATPTSRTPTPHKGPEEFRRRVIRGLGQAAADDEGRRASLRGGAAPMKARMPCRTSARRGLLCAALLAALVLGASGRARREQPLARARHRARRS